eukprot:TRINITY_DN367_c0_g2_i1.p1 TRINITY_DN367_c0_g2~~TRINITY_DN367_c0_g2_i1.p1  ORF type:complete len:464 (-),score=59.57 TRINITY_DN367_c0_g2_i1:32-1282(-)
MSTGQSRPYEVVVWGATGFTGKLVCRHIAENYQGSISWAMAGRDEKKLEIVRESMTEFNLDCQKVPIITAQLDDQASLDSMISKTKVLISTVGPFIRLGEPIVESCVRNQTHYCDTAGETPWVRRMIQKYHEQAQKTNTKIVNCCGFNCVPFDLGVYMVARHAHKTFGRQLKQAQVLLSEAKGSPSGGTLDSVLGLFPSLSKAEKNSFMNDGYFLLSPEQRGERKKRASFSKPQYLRESKTYTFCSFSELPNSQITYRSNALQGFKYGDDFEYVEGVEMTNAGVHYAFNFQTIILGILMPLLGPCIRRNCYPKAGDGPSWKSMTNGCYHIRVVGVMEGKEKPETVEAKIGDPARDWGYWGTSRNVLESALCLALQEDDLQKEGFLKGGVLTPAAAMGHVLIQRLQNANIYFNITQT